MNSLIVLVVAVMAALIGAGVGYFMRMKIAQAQANSMEAKADRMLTEAKTKQQEFILEGKDKAQKIVDEAKNEEKQIRLDIHNAQQRLEKREIVFDQKLLEFQDTQKALQEKIERVKEIKLEVENIKLQQLHQVERVLAHLTINAIYAMIELLV